MVYVDCEPAFGNLLKDRLRIAGKEAGVEIGYSPTTIIEKINTQTLTLLIYPFGHIHRTAIGELEVGSSILVATVQRGVNDGYCKVFGAENEEEIFGSQVILTRDTSIGLIMRELDSSLVQKTA